LKLAVVARLDQYPRAVAVDRRPSFGQLWQGLVGHQLLSEYWIARSSRAMTAVEEIFDQHPRRIRNGIASRCALQEQRTANKCPMPHLTSLLGFALVSLGLVLTPGPNMIYLISRSITQGASAGIVSLGGVALGFVFYMLCAAFGITALLFAVPYAYDALRLAGAAYLLWLAWQAVRPNGRSPFQVRKLAVDGPRKLFAMGFVTNLLNPKIAMLYLALLPQFIDPAQGSVLTQSLALGSIQIAISVSVNALIALAAGSIALFLGTRPTWLLLQRWLMGTVLAGLALRMVFEAKRG
jgi:threonine/homoserine/homoserine lactone efflux protein